MIINLIGKKFGKWTVLHRDGYLSPARWICKCSCGSRVSVLGANLRRGLSQGCKTCDKSNLTHGASNTPEYKSWESAKARCYNPRHRSYHRYGGRGITMCYQWVYSFERFLEDMGPRPIGTTLERERNDGNYEPGNCICATKKQQQNNTKQNRIVEFGGEKLTISAWADRLGIKRATLDSRLGVLGWTVYRAFMTPVKHG